MKKKVLILVLVLFLFFAFFLGMLVGVLIGVNIGIEKIFEGFNVMFSGSNIVSNIVIDINETELVENAYNLVGKLRT